MENAENVWNKPANSVLEVFFFHSFSTFSTSTIFDFPPFPLFNGKSKAKNQGFWKVKGVFPRFPHFPPISKIILIL